LDDNIAVHAIAVTRALNITDLRDFRTAIAICPAFTIVNALVDGIIPIPLVVDSFRGFPFC
jgi:hypothetical protein